MSTRSVDTTQANMAGFVAFLKNFWNKEPVVMAAVTASLLGIALPLISPYTKYTTIMNSVMPYNYPVPVRDDGNMPDIPAHPSEPKGNKMEWFKNR